MTQPPSDQPGSTAPGKTGPASLSGEGISLLQPGRQLGGYRIEKLLGRGGMAAVYLATQVSLNRPVALKVLDPRLSHDASFIQRFEQESGALAALNHPNIVNIIDRGEAGGLYFFVMEFVDGKSLDEMIVEDEVKPADFPQIIQGIREALTYVHQQGITHRDIKPANILVSRNGRVKVSDFGIVSIAFGALRRPEEGGRSVGTSRYMAPEQRRASDRVDFRADIYSLGVTFYKMFARALPSSEAWEGPTKHNPNLPDEIDAVLLKALQSNPDQRYQSVGEFCDDLMSVLWEWARRSPEVFGIGPEEAAAMFGGADAAAPSGAMPWRPVTAVPAAARPGTPFPQPYTPAAPPLPAAAAAPKTGPPQPPAPRGPVPPPPMPAGGPRPGAPALAAPVMKPGAAPAPAAAKKGGMPWPVLVLIIFCVVGVLAGVGFYFGMKKAGGFVSGLEAEAGSEEPGSTSPGQFAEELQQAMQAAQAREAAPLPPAGAMGTAQPGGLAQASGAASASTAAATPLPTPAATSAAPLKPEWVSIAEGWARIGEENSRWASPPRWVSLPAFQIHKYEVTNWMYAQFLQATGHPAPPYWTGGKFPEGQENYPVVEVSFFDAMAYAKWAGADLPTEEQWERAARGSNGWSYPWGPQWREDATNALLGRLLPVDAPTLDLSREGDAPGCCFMAGNVMEWTKSPFVAYPGGEVSFPKMATQPVVTRGCAFRLFASGPFNPQFLTRAGARSYVAAPEQRFSNLGFRCVMNSP